MPKLAVVPSPRADAASRAEQYRDQFVERFAHLPRALARTIAEGLPPCFTADDLEQEGALGLLAAADSYDRTRGRPEYWAWLCIRRAIYASVRRRPWRESLHCSIEHAPVASANPVEKQIDLGRMRKAVAKAKSLLPQKEQAVLELHFYGGESLASIADQMGVDRATAWRIRDRALRQMRTTLEKSGIRAA